MVVEGRKTMAGGGGVVVLRDAFVILVGLGDSTSVVERLITRGVGDVLLCGVAVSNFGKFGAGFEVVSFGSAADPLAATLRKLGDRAGISGFCLGLLGVDEVVLLREGVAAKADCGVCGFA